MQRKIGEALQLTRIQEEPFGWVFFYQSKSHLETGELSSMLAGNAPFIVDRKTGCVHILGTAHPADFYIKEYAQFHS